MAWQHCSRDATGGHFARVRLLLIASLEENEMKTQYSVGVGLVALGVGIAANAVLGPLVLDVIRFHNSVSGIN